MLPFTWSRKASVSCDDFWIALMMAVFCWASETTCACTSFIAEAVVESGAIVCVGFCTGAVEQPAARITAEAQSAPRTAIAAFLPCTHVAFHFSALSASLRCIFAPFK